MSFTDNNDRHSFPHRISTGHEIYGITVGPSEINSGHVDGSILVSNMEDGVAQTRRKRREKRTFILTYDFLEVAEWQALWDFYNDKAEHELHYFFVNLYYMDPTYTNEWIGVNFSQKIDMRNFDVVFATFGIRLVENLQATLTHTNPT